MGPLAIGGAAAGIGVKEWLYRVTLDAGKKHRSNVRAAPSLLLLVWLTVVVTSTCDALSSDYHL